MKIRSHLLIFALAVILPMVAFAVVAIVAYDRQQRAAVESAGVETARALMSAVDLELARSITTLEVLATARSLARDELADFYQDARRVLASQRDWMTISLASPAGTPKLNLAYAFGSTLPPIMERESFETVVRTKRPAIGPLSAAGPRGRLGIPVRVPVLRNAHVVYVMTGIIQPTAIQELLARQDVAKDWVGTLFDSKRVIVARTRGAEQVAGRPVSPGLSRMLDEAGEGWAGVSPTLEGAVVYTAFSRSPSTGWGVALGIPAATVDGPLRRSLLTVIGGGLALLAAAIAASVVIGRRIAQPMTALAAVAKSFGGAPDTSYAGPTRGPYEVLAVARAFTEAAGRRRRGETERAALLAAADAARAEAEAANHAKDRFLAVLSHELRTPLNSVMGWLRIMQRPGVDEARRAHALEVIERSTRLQIQLIDDLLDVSRIIAGKLELDRYPIELAPVIADAVDAVGGDAEARGVSLVTDLDPAAGPVLGDPRRLQQVATNLIANAVKFTPKGGRVEVRLTRHAGSALITVTDTGEGIPPDALPHIFEPFRQADSSATRAHQGLGLGLTIVRQLVELHGGTVTAESGGHGLGATFTVELPISAVRGRVVAAATEAPRAGSANAGRFDDLHVLVVDDQADARELLGELMREFATEVHVAGSANDALDVIANTRIDVVLSDLAMPGIDGYKLVRTIRAAERAAGRRPVPAIAVTAYAGSEVRQRTMAAGFQACLGKPVDADELRDLIAKVVVAGA